MSKVKAKSNAVSTNETCKRKNRSKVKAREKKRGVDVSVSVSVSVAQNAAISGGWVSSESAREK